MVGVVIACGCGHCLWVWSLLVGCGYCLCGCGPMVGVVTAVRIVVSLSMTMPTMIEAQYTLLWASIMVGVVTAVPGGHGHAV